MNMKIIIDKEIESYLPRLSETQFSELAKSIIAEGCRDPLVVWDNGDDSGILLDGHNRYRICQEHKIGCDVAPMSFPDRASALIWLIQNQFNRRNLEPYQRAELALKLEPLIAAKAKERQRCGQGGVLLSATLPEAKPIDTRAEVAKVAGIGERNIAKAKVIQEKAPEEVKERLRTGQTTINREYKEIVEGVHGELGGKKIRDPLDTEPEPKDTPEDKDSDTLFHLKRYWRMATKKDKQSFGRWINENTN